jgi:hypothetical protein
MIALDVDSGAMSVGRIPISCWRVCNLSAEARYYLIGTYCKCPELKRMQYQWGIESHSKVQ